MGCILPFAGWFVVLIVILFTSPESLRNAQIGKHLKVNSSLSGCYLFVGPPPTLNCSTPCSNQDLTALYKDENDDLANENARLKYFFIVVLLVLCTFASSRTHLLLVGRLFKLRTIQ